MREGKRELRKIVYYPKQEKRITVCDLSEFEIWYSGLLLMLSGFIQLEENL